jgi:hypothetical protein
MFFARKRKNKKNNFKIIFYFSQPMVNVGVNPTLYTKGLLIRGRDKKG